MSETTFRYVSFINVPPSQLYAHLAEPESYIGLSPLVTRVYNIKRATDADGRPVVSYVTVEAFRFLGFLRYDNHIKVLSTLVHPDTVLINDVVSPFNVRVRFVNEFTPKNGGTEVVETVSIQAPFWLKNFVVGQAKSTQQIRFARLKARLETKK